MPLRGCAAALRLNSVWTLLPAPAGCTGPLGQVLVQTPLDPPSTPLRGAGQERPCRGCCRVLAHRLCGRVLGSTAMMGGQRFH